MDDVKLLVEVEVFPTEDLNKVKRAVENVFGSLTFRTEELRGVTRLKAEASGREALTKFWNILRRERIRDAARAVFLEGLNGKTLTFYLNKQAAFVEHISFSEETGESPLGPLKVKIECENPRELINWLTQK